MYPNRLLKLLSFFLFSGVALLIVGCGASSTTASTAPAATPTCPPVQPRGTASGTFQSTSGNMITLTNKSGKTVTVSYTSNTRFIQQVLAQTSTLTSGVNVSVAVTQNPDNSYTATKITLAQRFNGGIGGNGGNGSNRFQGGQGVNPACFAQRRGGNNGGNNGGGNGAANGAARAINGQVSQLSGNSLVVTAANGDDFTVKLSNTTQILQMQVVTASALKAGMSITVTGTKNQGGITAQQVTILLPTTTK